MELVELLKEDARARALIGKVAHTEMEIKLAEFCLNVSGNPTYLKRGLW